MASLKPRQNITKSDMEASRLVFVYVRDAKPKRKVAVPVPDGYTWGEFLLHVKNKLKVTGVQEIYLASSGQKVTSLDELQDIDELCVVEGPENGSSAGAGSRSAGGASTSDILPPNGDMYRAQIMTPSDKHKVVVTDGASSSSRHDDEGKYTRRGHPLKRYLQRLFPSLFPVGLPVTTKDLEDKPGAGEGRSAVPGRRRRVGKRSVLSLRNILLFLAVATCVCTMLYFMIKGVGV